MIVCKYLTRMQSIVHHQNTRFFTFDLDLGVRVTQNDTKYPPHHATHGHENLKWLRQTVKEMHKKENTFFDHGIKVTPNIAQQLLYHASYSPAKF